jgi:hypothetical protein
MLFLNLKSVVNNSYLCLNYILFLRQVRPLRTWLFRAIRILKVDLILCWRHSLASRHHYEIGTHVQPSCIMNTKQFNFPIKAGENSGNIWCRNSCDLRSVFFVDKSMRWKWRQFCLVVLLLLYQHWLIVVLPQWQICFFILPDKKENKLILARPKKREQWTRVSPYLNFGLLFWRRL